MLTNIEWWGGLILIWLCLCFYFILVAFKEEKHSIVETVSTYIAFFCAVAVFSLYFYPLESSLIKQAYLWISLLGTLMTLLMFLWPDPRKEESDAEPEEEDVGPVLLKIIEVLIVLPFVICFIFAAYKIKDTLNILL